MPASIDTSKPPPNIPPPQLLASIPPPTNLPPPPTAGSPYMFLPGGNSNQNQTVGIAADNMPSNELSSVRPPSNLITIPIQDDPKQDQNYQMYPPSTESTITNNNI